MADPVIKQLNWVEILSKWIFRNQQKLAELALPYLGIGNRI